MLKMTFYILEFKFDPVKITPCIMHIICLLEFQVILSQFFINSTADYNCEREKI